MALFAPTNVMPSLIGQIGNGTVDVLNGIDVSWQVNGNTPMTAFKIDLYANNTTSDLLYSTGMRTDNCPFQGKDGLGNYRPFSFRIDSSVLISAGVENGNEYKLIVTQWWSPNDFIVQPSASAFCTRSTPRLSIDNIPSPLSSNKHTFNATYTQEQGDALNWVRWQIANLDELDQPFYDTQDIYGTSELKISYNGFFTGNAYAVKCMIQTVNGVFSDTGWQMFDVEYNVSSVTGVVETRCLRDKSAVSISWPGIYDIPGIASGEYSIDNESLTLKNGSSITWNTINDELLKLDAEWSLIWSGKLNRSSGILFELSTSKGSLVCRYDYAAEQITLHYNTQLLLFEDEIYGNALLSIIVTADNVYLRVEQASGYLTPSDRLYPSNRLYPSTGTTKILRRKYDISYVQGDISQIRIASTDEMSEVNRNMIIRDEDASTDYAYKIIVQDGLSQIELAETKIENPAQMIIDDRDSSTKYTYALNIDDGQTKLTMEPLSGAIPDEMILVDNDASERYSYEFLSKNSSLNMSFYEVSVDTENRTDSIVINYLEIVKGKPSQSVIEEVYYLATYSPIIEGNDYFLANFVSSLGAGTAGSVGKITGYSLYRQQGVSGRLVHLADISAMNRGVLDYGISNQQGPYTYYIFPHTDNGFVTDPYISQSVYPCWWDWNVLECRETADGYFDVVAEYRFGKNLKSGTITNNNAPNVLKNFTRYPTVQISPSNYQSGTLQSLIGFVGFNDKGEYKYSDTTQLRNGIYQLATTTNALFLRNRKGDVMRIRISGAIGMSTFDESVEQALTVSLPWCEIGDAKQVAIISAF